jgi:hypothetical protein
VAPSPIVVFYSYVRVKFFSPSWGEKNNLSYPWVTKIDKSDITCYQYMGCGGEHGRMDDAGTDGIYAHGSGNMVGNEG